MAILLMAPIGSTRLAFASGDDGCSSTMKLPHHDYEGCSNNMAFLSPSNDTRVNLLLMLADLRSSNPASLLKAGAPGRPDSPMFAWDSLVYRFEALSTKATPAVRAPGPQSNSAADQAEPVDDPFTLALQADHDLKPDERNALLDARKKTQSESPAAAAASAVANAQKIAKTPSAKTYALYLQGAAKFWHSDYDKATASFAALANAQPAWVRETATYMVGRSIINRAQVGAFDEYGSFNKDWHANAKSVADAEAALDKYLQQYPKGAYAQSARGLKRRGYWLAQDTARLGQEYGALLVLSPQERNVSDVELVEEIDNKLAATSPDILALQRDANLADKFKSTQNPLLLAMLDLQAMRTPDDATSGSSSGNILSLAVLQQQKPSFATQMPLYEYLLAVHAFYIENKPADVLRMIPDATHQPSFNYVQFSRQVLRGMALEAVKDHNALGFWKEMLPGTQAAYQRPVLELAVAYHQERAGQLHNVFAADSPVRYPYLREILLVNVADADLLRTQATNRSAPQHERDLALFTLLYKEATRRDAVSFLKDLALVPPAASTNGAYSLAYEDDSYNRDGADVPQPADLPLGIFLHDKTPTGFSCPGLRASEEQLAKDVENPTARLCLADFVRLNEAAQTFTSQAATPYPADQLGGTPSLFADDKFVRMKTYTAVLSNAKSSRSDKAYALFRAVNCYAPSGNNDCGGKDVTKAQRKAWFTTLKHDYAGTRWANELEFYW